MNMSSFQRKKLVQSCTTNNQNGTIVLIDNKFVKLPKLKSLVKKNNYAISIYLCIIDAAILSNKRLITINSHQKRKRD